MSIISIYANTEEAMGVLNNNPDLRKFANEFCHTFNVRVASNNQNNKLSVFTVTGIPAGFIGVKKGVLMGDKTPKDEYFYEAKDIVQKDRAVGGHNNRHIRTSKSIKHLITAIKRNGESPTIEKVTNIFTNNRPSNIIGIGNSDYNRPSIKLGSLAILAMAESYLDVDKYAVQTHTQTITDAYKEYSVRFAKYDEKRVTMKRFSDGGFKVVIGMGQMGAFSSSNVSYYLVGDMSLKDKILVIHEGLKRYDKLEDCPAIAVDVKMINTYMQGRPKFTKTNEFGLPYDEGYYEDIDVAVADGKGMYVFIPKVAP
jgi:hypothetical protein